MASVALRQQILEHFGDALASNEELLGECVRMCQMFNFPADKLFYKWEAFNYNSMNTLSLSTFNMDTAMALKSQIQRELATEKARSVQTKQAPPGNVRGLDRKFPGANLRRGDVVPVAGIPGSTSGHMVKTEMMDIVAGPSTVNFKGPPSDPADKQRRTYRYMYEKTLERSEALDDRIEEVAEIIREHYNISDFGDPAFSTENDITVVGRVTSDAESSHTPVKLNEASLVLESSRMMGSGVRVSLRFGPGVKIRGNAERTEGIGLFPGAIVALRGKNGGGGWFLVNEILAVPPMPSRTSLGKARPAGSPFSMCIACGPYTPDGDLQYKPWHQLLEKLKSTTPAVVLLLGPFIDLTNSRIKTGEIDHSPAQLFREEFSTRLRDFFDVSPNSLVLVVPSIKDVISDHATLPQCELGPEFYSDPRVHLLPNPCRFSINDVSFAVSTVDVLFHLRKEEFLKKGEVVDPSQTSPEDLGNDVMTNLCRHILQQRSFYPIFPVPLDLSHEVNLDVSHMEGLKLAGDDRDEYAPDILILPSRLKNFSKVVYDTMTINPSTLAKGQYVTLNSSAGSTGSMKDRFQVDMLRL